MAVVDAHVHLYPEEINRDPAGWAQKHGEGHWATLCTRVRTSGRPVQAFPSVDTLLREMDGAGVERAVLLGWYWETHYAARLQNRFFAECVGRHPDRLSAWGTVAPTVGADALAEELRFIEDQGWSGLGELSPHTQGGLAHPAWEQVWQWAAGRRRWVNLHVTEAQGKPYPGRVETPLTDFLTLAKRWPAVRFVLAHAGARLPLLYPEAKHLNNLWYDTAACSLIYGPAWETVLAELPAGRVFFGSDYPLDLDPRNPGTGWRVWRERWDPTRAQAADGTQLRRCESR